MMAAQGKNRLNRMHLPTGQVLPGNYIGAARLLLRTENYGGVSRASKI
jgi:hypothetical protein